MTDNFKFIYKILKTLEAAMDCPEFDITQVGHDKLGISLERWDGYLEKRSQEIMWGRIVAYLHN